MKPRPRKPPKPTPPKPADRFHLTITFSSVADWAAFIAIIRHDDLDSLPATIAKLAASNTDLALAESTQPKP